MNTKSGLEWDYHGNSSSRVGNQPCAFYGPRGFLGVEVHKIPGNHSTYIMENMHIVAKVLKDCLEKADDRMLPLSARRRVKEFCCAFPGGKQRRI